MSAQIVLENVGMRYPMRTLFEGVHFTLYDGMRVSLAGRNGSGKSTLLKIMAGELEPSDGKRLLVGNRKLRVGFLDQSLLDSTVTSLLHSGEKSQSPMAFLRMQIQSLNEDDVHEDRDWEIRRVLSGLGFSNEMMDASIHQLSGGWLLRMFIGGTLLRRPEVLLLDEPTNHLDISSIQWLEEFLQREYRGSLVLITHDVALQKRTTNSIAILHGGKLFFRTNTQDYLSFRESLAEEKRVLEKQIEELQKKIDTNLEFADKFRAKARVASRAQSKLKTAETLQGEQAELHERLAQVEGSHYDLHFQFRLSGAGGKFPLSLRNVSFRYKQDKPWILRTLNFDVKRGERIAIIGDNGAGKTTLLNVLGDRLHPSEGEVALGHAVMTGFFGQHQLDELLLEDSLLDNLRSRSAPGTSIEQLRNWLGAFGFRGTYETEKKAKVLSGGERARLALLRILVTPINLALLDEPTNHLDVETKELLKNAIRQFEGTIIFVSHDRDFVASLAERILYLTHDHKLTDHLGNLESFFAKYPQFVRHLEGTTRLKPNEPEKPATKATALSYEERKKLRNQMKALEKKISFAVDEIDQLGEKKDALRMQMEQMPDPQTLYPQMVELENILHTKMVEWEKWSMELEILKKKAAEE